MIFIKKIKLQLYLLLFLSTAITVAQSKPFVVILDAGHGGKDTGCKYHGFIEKQIALATTLKVGAILEKNSDIKIIYTRQDDTFIELRDRANIANWNNANLFVSIHCNGVTNTSAFGTETYVMSLARSKMNLEVAKRENSVILLEDNYKVKYKNFNPNNPESLIGIKIMQEENLNSSASLATKIQDNFASVAGRKSRGVKQEPLWVLDASSMPGVLIELGFISNEEEGAYLDSDEGQNQMAQQIATAIESYKKNYTSSSNEEMDEVEPKKSNGINNKNDNGSQEPTNTTGSTNVKYKIQICASKKKIAIPAKHFKGLKNITVTKDGSVYKYFIGNETNLEEVKKILNFAKTKGYKEAFIVSY